MTLHSQTPFNFHNEHMGRENHVTVPQVAHICSQDQDKLAQKWRELRETEKSGKQAFGVGAHTVWPKYEVLFAKHGDLTIGDLATMLGKKPAAVRVNLNGWVKLGMLEKEIVKGVNVYRLVSS